MSGVAAFAEDVDRWPGVMSEPELDGTLARSTLLWRRPGLGGGHFRRLQAKFCFDVARLTDCAKVATAGTALLRCADTWSAVAAAGRSDGSTLERWRRVHELAAALPTHEDKAVAEMRLAAAELAMGEQR